MKKFFAVILALSLVLVLLPAAASARICVPNDICRPYYCRPYRYFTAPVCTSDPIIPNLTYFVPGETYYGPVYPVYVPCVPAKKAPAIILNPELSVSEATLTVTANSLNVRKGPGTSYDVIGSLSKGSTVYVKSYSGSWAIIAFGDGYAYVSSAYLK